MVIEPGTRVEVKKDWSDAFSFSTGTVIEPVNEIWEVWVKLDMPILSNQIYGFRSYELTILAEP